MAPFNVFGDTVGNIAVLEPPPSTIPAGFDSVIQFSTTLLHRTLAANLSRRGLNPMSARVPYQPELVSPELRALIQPNIRKTDTVRGGVFLEVQVVDPTPLTLHWPNPTDVNVGTTNGGVITTARARGIMRPTRKVDLRWGVQLFLFKPAPTDTIGRASRASTDDVDGSGGSDGSTTVHGDPHGDPGNGGVVVVFDDTQPQPLPKGERIPLATGTATMNVPSELVVSQQLYQFSCVVRFDEVQPTYASKDPVMTEFLESDLGTAILAQAIAPLRNQSNVALTPTVALAGNLSASQVAQLHLPPIHVTDMVVSDDAGQALTMCVTLGNDPQGAFSLVRPFLAGRHFAYYVSSKVYTPVLKGLWSANAIHTPVVTDVPVEMPVEEGSDETGTGKARVKVSLSPRLSDAGLVASTDPDLGDPMRIASEQTVQLLALWDPRGHQIDDLGDLAKPTVEPFSLALQLFNKPAVVKHTVQSPMKNLLAAMFLPVFFPMTERYGVNSVSGYASSPLGAIVVRWSLPRVFDQVHDLPPGGVVHANF